MNVEIDYNIVICSKCFQTLTVLDIASTREPEDFWLLHVEESPLCEKKGEVLVERGIHRIDVDDPEDDEDWVWEDWEEEGE